MPFPIYEDVSDIQQSYYIRMLVPVLAFAVVTVVLMVRNRFFRKR